MSNNNETLKDIVAEMRGEKGFPVPFASMRGIWLSDYHTLADRMEAAAKQECNAAPGNAAALRSALEDTQDLLKHFTRNGGMLADAFALHMRDNDAALSMPARNCDRFRTAGEAMDAFFEEEAPADGETLFAQVLNWLFAPAEGGAE